MMILSASIRLRAIAVRLRMVIPTILIAELTTEPSYGSPVVGASGCAGRPWRPARLAAVFLVCLFELFFGSRKTSAGDLFLLLVGRGDIPERRPEKLEFDGGSSQPAQGGLEERVVLLLVWSLCHSAGKKCGDAQP